MRSWRVLACGTLLVGGIESQAAPKDPPEALVADLASEQTATRTKAVRAILAHPPSPALDRLLVGLLENRDAYPPRPAAPQWNTAVGLGGRSRNRLLDEPVLEEPESLRRRQSHGSYRPARGIHDVLDLQYHWPTRALAAFALGRRQRHDAAIDGALWQAFTTDQDDLVVALSAHAVEARATRSPEFVEMILDHCEQGRTNQLDWLLTRHPTWLTERLPTWLLSDRRKLRRIGTGLLDKTKLVTEQTLAAAEKLLTGSFARSREIAPILADLGRPTLPMLDRALHHKRQSVRMHAIGALALMESGAHWPASIADRLIEIAAERNLLHSHWALRALAKTPLDDRRLERVRRIVVPQTRSKNPLIVMIGCEHLAAFPFADDESLGALLRCAELESDVAPVAARGLARRVTQHNVDHLLTLLIGVELGDRQAEPILVAALAQDESLVEQFSWACDTGMVESRLVQRIACSSAVRGSHWGFLDRMMEKPTWHERAYSAGLSARSPSDKVRSTFRRRWTEHAESRTRMLPSIVRNFPLEYVRDRARECLASDDEAAIRAGWHALVSVGMPADLEPEFRTHLLRESPPRLLHAMAHLPNDQLAKYGPALRTLLANTTDRTHHTRIAGLLRKLVPVEVIR